MAGTIPGFSLTPQFDTQGNIAPGAKLYTIAAGTTSTPQYAYQDSALTILHPYPLVADSTGRMPQFFVEDGTIKIRMTDAVGNQLFVGDNLLVVGASSGGGGGGTVDATTVLDTGDLKVKYGTGALTGFVRCNGRTIGSATSSATERANSDTQALFEYLWGADANLLVSTGRGASAAADWAANKNIGLPDWRGRAIGGLDDMGNTAASRLSTTYFGTSAIVLGAASTGADSRTLVTGNLPAYTPSGSVAGGQTSSDEVLVNGIGAQSLGTGGTGYGWSNLPTKKTMTSAMGTWAGSFFGNAQGGTSTPLSIIQPTMLATIYIKL